MKLDNSSKVKHVDKMSLQLKLDKMSRLVNGKAIINILVDEETNKVLFAQAGKEFVDALLGLLMLPLGTIARLVSKGPNANKVSFGSISSLYESVSKLKEKQFWTAACKETLLRPKNPMDEYCQEMKLNIDTEKTKYYVCDSMKCNRKSSGWLSTFKYQKCNCGRPMNREISYISFPANKGFVPDATTFMISDDLSVKPDNFKSTICKAKTLGCNGLDSIKLVTVNVTKNEILELLKFSLVSTTPLTDVFLLKKQFDGNLQSLGVLDFDVGNHVMENPSQEIIEVKVIVRKSDNTILFALGDENFADLVLSFLTLPLVGVEHMLNGNSNMDSIDNLYKSLTDLDPGIYMRSPDLKDNLNIIYKQTLLPIYNVPALNSFCVSRNQYYGRIGRFSNYLTSFNVKLRSDEVCSVLSYMQPHSSNREAEHYLGIKFTKSPSLYMVTDDLVVKPGSSAATIAFLTKLRIPPFDLEERVIKIGQKERVSLIKASLISSSALTDGLGPFLERTNENNPKQKSFNS